MLRRLEREQRVESEGVAAAWAFLWVLFAFKIATVLIIMYVASGSGESLAMVAVTTWYWFLIPVLALSGPMLIRWRMIKLRRKREALQRSEWQVDPRIVTLHIPPDNGPADAPVRHS
jgi:H+/Cl- antiporter ClcA